MKTCFSILFIAMFALKANARSIVDVMFLIDESRSVPSPEFASQKAFASAVGNYLTFGPTNYAAGSIGWDDNIRVVGTLSQSRNSFLNGLKNMVQQDGTTTNLVTILQQTTNYMEGAAGRADAERVIVICIEGQIKDDHATLTNFLDSLASQGYHIFPVGGFSSTDRLLPSLARNRGTVCYINQSAAAAVAIGNVSTNPPPKPPLTALIYPAVEIGWLSQTGKSYQVQWAPTLNTSQWFNLGPAVPGTGSTNYVFDSARDNTNKFYRVQENP